jgi:hypothetical protein
MESFKRLVLKLIEERNVINIVTANNNVVDQPKEIAEAFKNQFETCATKLSEAIPDDGECEILMKQKQEWGFHAINQN